MQRGTEVRTVVNTRRAPDTASSCPRGFNSGLAHPSSTALLPTIRPLMPPSTHAMAVLWAYASSTPFDIMAYDCLRALPRSLREGLAQA